MKDWSELGNGKYVPDAGIESSFRKKSLISIGAVFVFCGNK